MSQDRETADYSLSSTINNPASVIIVRFLPGKDNKQKAFTRVHPVQFKYENDTLVYACISGNHNFTLDFFIFSLQQCNPSNVLSILQYHEIHFFSLITAVKMFLFLCISLIF